MSYSLGSSFDTSESSRGGASIPADSMATSVSTGNIGWSVAPLLLTLTHKDASTTIKAPHSIFKISMVINFPVN